jgi:hypothetical protein
MWRSPSLFNSDVAIDNVVVLPLAARCSS